MPRQNDKTIVELTHIVKIFSSLNMRHILLVVACISVQCVIALSSEVSELREEVNQLKATVGQLDDVVKEMKESKRGNTGI